MIVGIDTEFFDSQEARMKVVAAVLSFPTETKRYNLLNLEEQYSFQLEMDKIKERKDILIAHATAAEARSLMALGLEPFDYQWIDTYIEFTMLCNSNDKYRYGDYLGDTGDIRTSFKPDPSSDEESILDHTETPKSLVNTIYKMLGIKLDQEQKEAMRTLILSKNLIEINERINEILDYCESDTIHLINLDAALTKAFESEGLFDFREDQLARGRYAVATAKSENLGIPINLEFLNKIINKTPVILDMYK